MTRIVAVDYDGTLVDRDGEWLPLARDALRAIRRMGFEVVIHSSRANWEGGVEQIRQKLATATFKDVRVEPKLDAFRYVDNLAVPYTGDWHQVVRELRAAS